MQLLDTYQLPTRPPLTLPVSAAIAALFKDKKNASSSPADGACVSVVLMSHLGRPVVRRSLPVPAWLVASTMAHSLSVAPPSRPILADIRVPGSKSVSNRALLLAALCPHPVLLSGMLQCDDTRVMVQGDFAAPCSSLHPGPSSGAGISVCSAGLTCCRCRSRHASPISKRLRCSGPHAACSAQLAAAVSTRSDLQRRRQRYGRQWGQVRDMSQQHRFV
jgi:hypothetical protein